MSTVVVEVDASNDIATVDTQAALDAAKVPTLFMQLKFGTKLQGFKKGTAAEDSIVLAPKLADFEMTINNDGDYVYAPKANTTGNSVATQIIGKTNKSTVGNSLKAPGIKLTWTAEPSYLSEVGVSTSANSARIVQLDMSDGNFSIKDIKVVSKDGVEAAAALVADTDYYVVNKDKIVFNSSVFAAANKGGTLKVTFAKGGETRTATLNIL